MSIHLFKHNQEAYNSVTAMLEREKMAAVIHPTGTVTGNLTEEKVRKLNEISMIWDVRDHGWNEALTEMQAYYKEHGNLDIRARYETADGFKQEKKTARQWNEKYELAKNYYEIHGDLNVPLSYCVNDVKLGWWISNIRSKRKYPGSNGMALSQERIRQLDNIGMNWK